MPTPQEIAKAELKRKLNQSLINQAQNQLDDNLRAEPTIYRGFNENTGEHIVEGLRKGMRAAIPTTNAALAIGEPVPTQPVQGGRDRIIVQPSKQIITPDRNIHKYPNYYWFFCEIRSASGSFFVSPSDYPQYNSFVATGERLIKSESLSKSDGTASVVVEPVDGGIDITVTVQNRSYVPFPPTYATGTIEVWTHRAKSDGNIQTNRNVLYASYAAPSGFTISGFTFFGGNPGNRTGLGVLQSNSYYKYEFSAFNITPIPQPNGTAQVFYKVEQRPYSVPFAPDFVLP